MIGQKYRIIKQNNPPMKLEFTGTLYDIKSEEVPYSTNLLSGDSFGGRFVTNYLFKNITNITSTSSSGEKNNLRAKSRMIVTSDDTFQYYRINGARQEIENPEEYYNIQSGSTTSAKEIENPEEYYNTISTSSEPNKDSKMTNPASWSSRMRRFQPTTWSAGMRSRKLRKSKKKRKTRKTRRKKKFRRRRR